MQNNLDEYYTMVNFICENLLGEKREFNNRYKNPIEAGKSKDATWQQVLPGFYTRYPYNFILIILRENSCKDVAMHSTKNSMHVSIELTMGFFRKV
jgi:SNF2 family DNA or RNA helicase